VSFDINTATSVVVEPIRTFGGANGFGSFHQYSF
jgi:hypothetical protein